LPIRFPGSPSLRGEVVRWSGIPEITQYPNSNTPSGSRNPSPSSWDRTLSVGSSAPRLEGLANCDDDCDRHSETVHDALRLLRARHMIPFKFLGPVWDPRNLDDFMAWLRAVTWTAKDSQGEPHGNLSQLASPTQDLAHLPIPATRLNTELLKICTSVSVETLTSQRHADRLAPDLKLISRFKSCLDGNPDSSNPYIKYYVPYCIQTPLLAQVAIYTSACFLNETGHLDRMIAMAHKGQAIRMLNDHLRSKSSTSDEAITAVIQLIMDEWYWGETGDLRAHLRGLREMIRLRGGLRNLGMNGMISKLAIAYVALFPLKTLNARFEGLARRSGF
jgi:hypothetical protein